MSELEIRFAPKWLESFLFFCWVIFFWKKRNFRPLDERIPKKKYKKSLYPYLGVLFCFREWKDDGPCHHMTLSTCYLGGGFKYFLFHPYLGRWSHLTHIFQMGWFNHQPVFVWKELKGQVTSWDFFLWICVTHFLESFLELQNEKSQCLKMKNVFIPGSTCFICCIHIPFCKTPGEIKTIGCTPNSVPMVFIGLSHRGTLVGVHPTIPWKYWLKFHSSNHQKTTTVCCSTANGQC